jgi:hypothetical protein
LCCSAARSTDTFTTETTCGATWHTARSQQQTTCTRTTQSSTSRHVHDRDRLRPLRTCRLCCNTFCCVATVCAVWQHAARGMQREALQSRVFFRPMPATAAATVDIRTPCSNACRRPSAA